MSEEIWEELRKIVEYPSPLRELEMWLYTFIEDHDGGEMTMRELHEKIQEMMADKENG